MSAWHSDYEVSFGRVTEAVKLLLFVTIGAYALQIILSRSGWDVDGWFGLSLDGLKHGYLWQIFSYIFLHGPLYHLLLNMLVLFMMGPETERAMGKSQFLIMYFVSGVLGGIGWLIISAVDSPTATCVGASGAIFGIIGAFAALFPHRHITLLLFFVLPITLKAWVLAAVLGGIELMFLLTHMGGGVANAAHLAGGLAGFIYAYTVFRNGALGDRLSHLWRGRNLKVLRGGRSVGEQPEDAAEIDRILDKIEREGMQSLTSAERDRLHRKSRELRGE